MKKNAFFITFKGLSMKQIKQFFFEGESLNLSKQQALHADLKAKVKQSILDFSQENLGALFRLFGFNVILTENNSI